MSEPEHESIPRRVIGVLARQLNLSPADISPEDKLQDLADMDSLDIVELVMALEDEFGVQIPDEKAAPVTVVDVVEIVRRELP